MHAQDSAQISFELAAELWVVGSANRGDNNCNDQGKSEQEI